MRKLQSLLKDPAGRAVDDQVRRQLSELAARTPGLGGIRIRDGFVRSATDLPGASDRHRAVTTGWPPASVLATAPRGVALPVALTALFLAQVGDRRVYKAGKLQLPLRPSATQHLSWADVVAVPADFRGGTPGAGITMADLEDNRERQLRDALDRLDVRPRARSTKKPQPVIGLFEAIETDARGRRRATPVAMYEETGPRSGPSIRYQRPDGSGYFAVPATFWTNGWVHALTSSEIACLLMYLRFEHLAPLPAASPGLAISALERAARHGLTRDAYDTHRTLEQFGLLHVTPDPNRRTDGTIKSGASVHGEQHRIKALTAGLDSPAVATVLAALE